MPGAEPQVALRYSPRFQRFWLGRLLANTAQNAILLALLVTVVNRTGQTIHSSLLVLSFILPATVLGVVGGVVVDHLPKRPVLALSCLLRALLCLAFLRSNESVWVIYGVNLALSAVTQFSSPAESAVVPQLMPKEQFATATSLLNVGVIVAQVLGSVLLAPLFLKTLGPDPLFFLTIMLFLSAGLCFSLIPRLQKRPEAEADEAPAARYRGLRSSAADSWQMMRSSRPVFLAAVQNTLTTTTVVVLIALLPNYTKNALHLPAENAVFIFAPAAIGVALGNWLVPRLVQGRGKGVLGSLGFLIFLCCLTCLGFSTTVIDLIRAHGLLGPLGSFAPGFAYSPATFAALVSGPLGFGYALVLATSRLVTYEHVPAQMHGRIFAFQGVLSSVASIVPLLLVGFVAALIGPRLVLALVAASDLLALVYARASLPPKRPPVARGSSSVVARS